MHLSSILESARWEGERRKESAMELEERPKSLARLDEAIHACRRCPIGLLENQAEDEMKERQERLFHADLAAVAERMAELAA